MKFRIHHMIAVLAPVACLSACSTQAPLRNLQNQQIPATLSSHQVVRAITVAAHEKGWQVSQVRPGLLYAKIDVRSHVAQVKIPYTRSHYSILYRGSSNLNYNGHEIHRNYNRWVANLNKYIQQNLTQTYKKKG